MAILITVAEPNISDLERKYVDEAISSGWVSGGGPFVDRFEELLCKHTGATWAVAVQSGTAALHVAITASMTDFASSGTGLVRSMNFIAVANALSYCGLEPAFCDLCGSWTPDHSKAGNVVDAAPSIASVPVTAGALTCLSFNGNKTITTGQGGAVLGVSPWQEDVVRSLASVCKVKDAPDNYEFDSVGFNYRMSNITAAFGCAQMERLPGFIERKRAIMQAYRDAGLKLLTSDWMAVADVGDRNGTIRRLADAGIEATPFWKPLHLQAPYQHCVRSSMTRTEAIWQRLVCLPCSTNLTEREQAAVIKALS